MAKMGRPEKKFNWSLLDSLCGLNTSLWYLCERLIESDNAEAKEEEKIEINIRSIRAMEKMVERRIKQRFDCTFVEYRDKRLNRTRIKLFQKQVDVALNGNVAMLIWLGKQFLDQTDVEKAERREQADKINEIHETINVLKLVKES